MKDIKYRALMENAKEVSKNAYVPYSKFPVGACVLTENDKMFSGCNFENASFGLTICAERNAIGSAITEGESKIKAIAIYSPQMEVCYPCGACRQVLNEFKPDDVDMDIVLECNNDIVVMGLSELLPGGFNL